MSEIVLNTHPKHICIQGLGFVGAAMAVAVANARAQDGSVLYRVTGVDCETPQGRERVQALCRGEFPFPTTDAALHEALHRAYRAGNLSATTDESVYASADVVVIDIALDIHFLEDEPQLQMASLEQAVRSVAQKIPEGSLVMVETTVPPGTCEKVLVPLLGEELQRRGLDENTVHLAHSFERVMPGAAYLDSITRFWRVYAGATVEAADRCEAFLATIVDVESFPLMRLSSMTASETAKVMENTYRATNIAFIDEWTKYAETVGIDLYEVIDAIRVRPTHSNIRFPGLGVGGYCLTKDPAFAPAAARQLFGEESLEFPFSRLALQVNQAMPAHTVARLQNLLGGNCKDASVLVLGLSYRQDVGDTRYSPVETLVRGLEADGARVTCFDPFIDYWPEMDRFLPSDLPEAGPFDVVVLATPHKEFFDLDLPNWLDGARPVVLDTVNVVSKDQRQRCRAAGIRIESVGRGDGL
jgi:nucleotide sugar dehydrogenase